jgi:CMP-N,N'-diacetyllegionaminic acid synthase
MSQPSGIPRVVALIPARSGSKRVPGKNISLLGGHPMVAYTISAALQSGVFHDVIVSTDSEKYADIAHYYGANIPFLRPEAFSGDKSPDIEWIHHAIEMLKEQGNSFDCFSILRPTSPFRKAETIKRAWTSFINESGVDSLRAVEKCTQHPGKMWILSNNRMHPLLPFHQNSTPWHSSQYPALPEIYVQNASLEIAWIRVPLEKGSIAGDTVMPFLTEGYEGFDINNQQDINVAEALVRSKPGLLPEIKIASYSG